MSWPRELGAAGGAPVCSRSRFAAVSTSVAAGDRGASPAITSRGGPAAGDRVEVDRRRRRGTGSVRGEAGRAEPAEGAAVGGEEDERVRRPHALLRRRCCGLRVRARELDQRRRARRVVVRARRRRRCRRGAPSRRSRRPTGPRRPPRGSAGGTRPSPGPSLVQGSDCDRQAVGAHLVAEPRAPRRARRRCRARDPGSCVARSTASVARGVRRRTSAAAAARAAARAA